MWLGLAYTSTEVCHIRRKWSCELVKNLVYTPPSLVQCHLMPMRGLEMTIKFLLINIGLDVTFACVMEGKSWLVLA